MPVPNEGTQSIPSDVNAKYVLGLYNSADGNFYALRDDGTTSHRLMTSAQIVANGAAVAGTQASTDGQGEAAQGLITLGYLFGYNGASWDRLRVDTNKSLKTASTDTAGNALTFVNNRVPSSLGSVAVGAGGSFPAALTASTDTLYRFVSTAHRFVFQNNTTVAVYVEFGSVASPGSLCLPPASGGVGSYLEFWWEGTDVHLYSTLASSVNGTVAGGIVLKGFE